MTFCFESPPPCPHLLTGAIVQWLGVWQKLGTVSSNISPFIFKSAKIFGIQMSRELTGEHQQSYCQKSEGKKSTNYQHLSLIDCGEFGIIFSFRFPLPTRDMVFKKFYDQYFVPVLVFTRSDRGQGGEGEGDHYHHIRPVKSCLTDFTQSPPLVKCCISTDFGF